MKFWDLLKKYNCINIEVGSEEEMKELVVAAIKNGIKINYLDYYEGIYVYFDNGYFEITNEELIKNATIKQYNYEYKKIRHHLI